MSHLNISLSSFRDSRSRVRHGFPLGKLNLNLHVLARAFLPASKSKDSDLAAAQAGKLVTESKCNTRVQDVKQGCKAYVSNAEYQHLVDLGHWHHRRQRRRARIR